MKRFLFVAVPAFALLVPALTFAQVRTVYIPGAHPRVVVVQAEKDAAAVNAEKTAPTPVEVIARHEAMVARQRVTPHVNYAAAAHCDREIANARAALRRNF